MKKPDKTFGLIIWGDAHSRSEEQTDTNIKHEPEVVHTYGWILRSNEVGVTVAAEWFPGDNLWRDTTFVPRAMVIQEVVLNIGVPRRPKVRPTA